MDGRADGWEASLHEGTGITWTTPVQMTNNSSRLFAGVGRQASLTGTTLAAGTAAAKPSPATDLPATFGNTDIYGGRYTA